MKARKGWARRRHGRGRARGPRPHWCKACKGARFVAGPPAIVDLGRGPETFSAVLPCPNLSGPAQGDLDRQRKAAGETEAG